MDPYNMEGVPHSQRPRSEQYPASTVYTDVVHPGSVNSAGFVHHQLRPMPATELVNPGFVHYDQPPPPHHVMVGPSNHAATATAITTAHAQPWVPPESGDESDGSIDTEAVDTSTMTKEELRKYKNRQSASRSRERTRKRMEMLETRVRDLAHQNQYLEEQKYALLMDRAARTEPYHYPNPNPNPYPPPYYDDA